MENTSFYLVPLSSLLALGFAFYFFRSMMKHSEGTDTMKRIAQYVREGAMSYLKQQYKVVTIVFIVLAIIFGVMAFSDFQICGCLLPSSPEDFFQD